MPVPYVLQLPGGTLGVRNNWRMVEDSVAGTVGAADRRHTVLESTRPPGTCRP